jgi:hypothetical protein
VLNFLRPRSFLLEQTRINSKSPKLILIIEGIQARFILPLHSIRNERTLKETPVGGGLEPTYSYFFPLCLLSYAMIYVIKSMMYRFRDTLYTENIPVNYILSLFKF